MKRQAQNERRDDDNEADNEMLQAGDEETSSRSK